MLGEKAVSAFMKKKGKDRQRGSGLKYIDQRWTCELYEDLKEVRK
jgi:hypothetical protein